MSSPAISAGVVTVGGRDGFLYGLDLASGRELWRITHDGSSWIASPAIDDGVSGLGAALRIASSSKPSPAIRW